MAPLPFDQLSQSLEPRTPIPEAAPLPHLTPEELTLRLLLTQPRPAGPRLQVRQQLSGFYPESTYYGINAGPSPGAVVGIVLGSVGGFLLLIYLLWTLSNGTTVIRTTGELEEVDEVRSRTTRSRRRRSRPPPEMVSRSDVSRPQRVYRSERIIRDFPPERSRSPSMARSRRGDTVIIEERTERRVEGDDIIEVMEEHSSIDAPRRKRRSERDRY